MTDLIEYNNTMLKGACPCFACDQERQASMTHWDRLTAPCGVNLLLVCPTCGNKRCPKATHHGNACTGSNEPGQTGSRFVATAK